MQLKLNEKGVQYFGDISNFKVGMPLCYREWCSYVEGINKVKCPLTEARTQEEEKLLKRQSQRVKETVVFLDIKGATFADVIDMLLRERIGVFEDSLLFELITLAIKKGSLREWETIIH